MPDHSLSTIHFTNEETDAESSATYSVPSRLTQQSTTEYNMLNLG